MKKTSLSRLQDKLAVQFIEPGLLRLALTHSSHASTVAGEGNNERLEFLGDAVLDLVISTRLFTLHPDLSEGVLSRTRSSLVNERHLALVARALELGRYLALGKGEECSGGREKNSILASAYEAVVGAVFLDLGYETASRMIGRHFAQWLKEDMGGRDAGDSKSLLQEKLQAMFGEPPQYLLVGEMGPDHEKEFAVEVRFRGETLGRGSARSKKGAEKRAAKEALLLLQSGQLPDSMSTEKGDAGA